ncbi:MAG: glucose-6-phosphate dehydrogenase [Bacteroides sp.]|nr:glucose-6-phosphate dehydrogenase [Bacteroides sp.]
MDKMIMIIFGASGDLTRRKLMPALYQLYCFHKLPEGFRILGTGRIHYEDEAYQEYIGKELKEFLPSRDQDEEALKAFTSLLHYVAADPSKEEGYQAIKKRLEEMQGGGEKSSLLFYLATPPSLYGVIPPFLKKAGLHEEPNRIVVEKPFGYDLESARKLNQIYKSVFEEEQIYRIDHFLGKETVQNILAFRFANGIFEPLWNRNYIEYIEVTAVENMGVESRGGYFNSAGTLRDMVQNHLLQLVAITAMEPPVSFNADYFRNELLKIYESLTPFTQEQISRNIIRGQYTASDTNPAYRQEKDIPEDSRTETYVAMKIGIDNWRWSGVPFFIRTGKELPTKVTEIVVHFKDAPHQMFSYPGGKGKIVNTLILRIQPNEGIVLKFGMKLPGTGFQVQEVSMDFSYSQLSGEPVMDAYARLIEDCIAGDATLFNRSDVVESSWTFLEPVLTWWKEHAEAPLYGYPAGTWGPIESEALISSCGTSWTNPCKNLTDTDKYCEL